MLSVVVMSACPRITRTIPEDQQDLQLPEKLRAELPGILNWALEGLRQWMQASAGGKRRGLPHCQAVDSATAEYRGEQDRLKQFLEDCTEPAPGYTVQAGILYQTYKAWCEENGERFPLTGTKFGREVAKTLQRRKNRLNYEYVDLHLTDDGTRILASFGQKGSRFRTGEPLSEQLRMETRPCS